MAMVMEEPEAKRIVEEQLEEMLDQRNAVPLALHVSGDLVAIKDLSPLIKEFREQKEMLERADSTWPSILVSFRQRPELDKRWMPLDLRDGIRSHEPRDSVEKRLQSQEIQQNIIRRAQQANLDAQPKSREEVIRNFQEVLSDTIAGRASQPASREDDEPPSEEFKVTTDDPNQEILFATGYFISTRQGFGISTPAIRKLPWRPYIFGINKRRELLFSDTVWTVPDVLSIHLTV
jgi:hypothetical protein